MDTLTITLQLPDGLKAWLASEGKPLYRKAPDQAAYLCSEYLKRAFKTASQASKNGSTAQVTEAQDASA
jgi:hypothetical protein